MAKIKDIEYANFDNNAVPLTEIKAIANQVVEIGCVYDFYIDRTCGYAHIKKQQRVQLRCVNKYFSLIQFEDRNGNQHCLSHYDVYYGLQGRSVLLRGYGGNDGES